MPNRAVNQFPTSTTRETGDLFYIVRSGTDRSLEQEAMSPQYLRRFTNLSSAEILALNTTPITLVPSTNANKIIVPVMVIMRYTGTVNYATHVNLTIGFDTIISDTVYVGIASIVALTQSPYRMSLIGGTLKAGVDLVARVNNGNPTTGDSDILMEVYYQLLDA